MNKKQISIMTDDDDAAGVPRTPEAAMAHFVLTGEASDDPDEKRRRERGDQETIVWVHTYETMKRLRYHTIAHFIK